MAQEALTNVARHAQTRAARVEIAPRNGHVELTGAPANVAAAGMAARSGRPIGFVMFLRIGIP